MISYVSPNNCEHFVAIIHLETSKNLHECRLPFVTIHGIMFWRPLFAGHWTDDIRHTGAVAGIISRLGPEGPEATNASARDRPSVRPSVPNKMCPELDLSN